MGMKRRMALLLALLLFGMLGALAENDLVLVDVDLDPEEPGINEEALDFVLDDPDLSLDMSLEIDDMEDPPLDLSDVDQNIQVELSETGPANNAVVGDTVTENGIRYEITDAGAVVAGYDGEEPVAIVIPSAVEGFPVVSIKYNAFLGCASLTSVTLPDGLASIGELAFIGCTSLTNVTLPDGLTAIGDSAFSGCTLLANLTLPEGVISVGERAFSGCTSLESLIFPDSVTTIGLSVFERCVSLKRVVLSKGLTSIGQAIFAGCDGLEELTMPVSALEAGFDAKKIVVVSDGQYELPFECFRYREKMEEITLSDGLTGIGDRAFWESKKLRSIKLPNTLKTIGEGAFAGCTKLASISIPASATNLGGEMFAGCAELASVSVCKLSGEMFAGCTGLKKAVIVEGATEIPESAFSYCTSLEEVVIPNTVTDIGESAFWRCKALASIDLPDSLKRIELGAFNSCIGLKRIVIPNGVTEMDEAFTNCTGLKEVTIPGSVEDMGGTFAGCTGLEKVVISNGVEVIADSFLNCTSLKEVTLPKSLRRIDGAFVNCTSLKQISLPNGLTEMFEAFKGCTALKSVAIPSSVTHIDRSFYGCTALNSIALPSSVTHMSDAFFGCTSLKKISIPNSVDDMFGAFIGCEGLKSVSFAEGVNAISPRCFDGCVSLKSVTIPGSVKSIGQGAFIGCYSLETVNINSGAKQIDDFAFAQCGALQRVNIPKSVNNIGDNAFSICDTYYWPTPEEEDDEGTEVDNEGMDDNRSHSRKGYSYERDEHYVLEGDLSLPPNLVLHVVKGSKAEAYAKKYKIPVEVEAAGLHIVQGNSATLCVGCKLTLTARTGVSDTKGDLSWSSSNKKVAMVSKKGVVKALAKGTAIITVKTSAGKKATCKITVPTAPKSVRLNKTKATLKGGESLNLKATLSPSDAKTVFTWASSDKRVATVSDEGTVIALAKGSATITVKTSNGKSASCKISVSSNITKPLEVKLNMEKATVVVGGSLTLKATISPSGVKSGLTWTTSNARVVTVSDKGVVKGLKKGTATITVKTSNGKSATCKVIVPTAPKKISLRCEGKRRKGETLKLIVKLTPDDAKTTLTFTSSDNKVATVTDEGVVTCLSAGRVSIRVKTANGLSAIYGLQVKE